MIHRGPDDEGTFSALPWASLAFRRLSIIDLSGGHQPLGNEDGSIQVILNGEIYNYRELTEQLTNLGHVFRTKSDTEVIVHAYEEYGDAFVEHLRGMFGLAVLDLRRRRLVVARDRMGIKPLYWFEKDGLFLFASEIKALLAHPSVRRAVNWSSVGEYLAQRYALGPETMFEGIQRLSPATLMSVDAEGIQSKIYWEPIPKDKMIGNSMEAAEVLEKALMDAVRSHMISDVPVGLFLSGGIDSTALLAVMSQYSGSPVQTFTANLGDNETTDVVNARTAAKFFGAEYNEVKIEPNQMHLLEKIVWHLDQPISDPAVLPTMLLSQAARKQVTVVLAGEGSDEINGGYHKYARRVSYGRKEAVVKAMLGAWPLIRHVPALSNRIRGFIPLAMAKNEAQQCMGSTDALVNMLNGPVMAGAMGVSEKIEKILDLSHSNHPIERMQHVDRMTWMSECTLVKTDRMTMAASLEARVPFLDHLFVEQALRVEPRLRVGGKQTKMVLRKWLRHLYPLVASRSQAGFVLPLAQWSRDATFNRLVSSMLSKENLTKRGVVDPVAARSLVEEFLATGTHTNSIWRLLCLELWFQKFFD